MGVRDGSDGRVCLQCRRPGCDPWVGKIPWRRTWQPTPVFLPGESHPQRSLAAYSLWVLRVGHDWVTKHTAQFTTRGVGAFPPLQSLLSGSLPSSTEPFSCCEHLPTKYIFAHGCILVESVLRTGSTGE